MTADPVEIAVQAYWQAENRDKDGVTAIFDDNEAIRGPMRAAFAALEAAGFRIVGPGPLYRHHKGNLYEVIGHATHSETLEELTIYRDVEKGLTWARPSKMFHERLASGKERFEREIRRAKVG